MSKTILICGYGTGISHAIAEKFGAQGFAVGLVARNQERLQAGVKELSAKGIRAAAFQVDLADTKAAPALVSKARLELGPITALQWNAYASGAGDLLASDATELRAPLDLAVTSLVAVVQAALPDLKETKGSVLVTNGGFGLLDQQVDAAAVQWSAMGLSVANAAKHKLVRLLSEKLKADGVYVGEVMVLSSVKGTAWDSGSATLDASTVGAKFWQLNEERRELSVKVG
jgi:NADP-dependent 3-hydroxy acid dehydrogenase YdfG